MSIVLEQPMNRIQDPKRKLILGLRRKVKVQSRFDVVALGGGQEKQTCRTCGFEEIVSIAGKGQTLPDALAKRLTAYRAHSSGVSGTCPNCSKIEAERRYPLVKGPAHAPHRSIRR